LPSYGPKEPTKRPREKGENSQEKSQEKYKKGSKKGKTCSWTYVSLQRQRKSRKEEDKTQTKEQASFFVRALALAETKKAQLVFSKKGGCLHIICRHFIQVPILFISKVVQDYLG
jgi:hypothetical protein